LPFWAATCSDHENAGTPRFSLDNGRRFCYQPPLFATTVRRGSLACAQGIGKSARKTGSHVQVLVRDNNVDQALRALKKKMQREGIFREMKMRGHYEKPSEKRAREKAEAVRRARKLARKRAQREGLIAAPKAVAR
jgi:small subunit ribosomal protein S21